MGPIGLVDLEIIDDLSKDKIGHYLEIYNTDSRHLWISVGGDDSPRSHKRESPDAYFRLMIPVHLVKYYQDFG